MTVLRFSPADLAGTRFAMSPTWETVCSRWVLRRPERSPHHRTWLREATRADAQASFARHARVLDAFVRPSTWLPDFLTPPPSTASPDFEAELAVVAATPPDVVRADILATRASRPLTAFARQVADDPGAWLPAVVDAVRAWHRVAVAAHWPRMQTLLESDIAYRAATFARHGPGRMFESIHESLSWHDDALHVDDPHDTDIRLAGGGMPLMPSLFFTNRPAVTVRPESPPSLVYAARAAGTLWDTRRTPPADQALGALLGASRARLLALLEAPATTTQAATRLDLAPAAVSAHLKVLHEGGLVSRHRHGREVFYVLTDLGRRLVEHG